MRGARLNAISHGAPTVAKVKGTLRPRKVQGDPLNTPGHSERGPTVGAAADEPIVLDDLPEVIPVARPELEVIETYLGGLIDRLLMDAASDRAMAPVSTNSGKPIRASRPRS